MPPSRRSIDPCDVLALLDAEELEALAAAEDSDIRAIAKARDGAWLLQWLTERRTPFIKMAAEVCDMLTALEASIPGNIDFVILPDQGADLVLDFRPQMRRAVATALRVSALAKSVSDVRRRLAEAHELVQSLCRDFEPELVKRSDNAVVQQLLTLARTTRVPGKRWEYELTADRLSTSMWEYHPADVMAMKRVADAAADLQALGERLGQQAPPKADSPGAASRRDIVLAITGMAKVTAARSAAARTLRSWRYPRPRRCLTEFRYRIVERRIAELKSSLLSASDAEDAAGELFDFYSLELWRQRWRLFELWLLARLLHRLMAWGARIARTSRIVKGRWSLKFTRDSLPVLGLELGGHDLDLYYQYFEASGARANMPDIALRLQDDDFVLVLDPKHGASYSRRDMNEVCLRYAKAFAPAACCVMNYFPRSEPVKRLLEAPSCTVLYGVQPDSKVAIVLDGEFAASLGRLRLPRFSLVLLFDVSGSTAGLRGRLREQARQAAGAALPALAPESRALLFAGEVVAEGSIVDFLDGTLDSDRIAGGGTNFTVALSTALDGITALSPPRAIWLFTDGQGVLDAEALEPLLACAGTRLRIWEIAREASPSALVNLAAAVATSVAASPRHHMLHHPARAPFPLPCTRRSPTS